MQAWAQLWGQMCWTSAKHVFKHVITWRVGAHILRPQQLVPAQKSSTTMHRALSIPDTLCIIFDSLDHPDASNLGQVCNKFFSTSLPFVWQAVRLVDLMRTLALPPAPEGPMYYTTILVSIHSSINPNWLARAHTAILTTLRIRPRTSTAFRSPGTVFTSTQASSRS